MSLRTDERSWLIHDDDSIGAVVRGLEAYALSVTGQKLSRHSDKRIRAIGSMMVRLGEQRGHEMLRNDGAQREAVEAFALLGTVLAGVPHDPVKAESALDELHAVVFRLDQKAQIAGVQGPGTVRQAMRGD
jgi:hypothetical protein